MSETAASRKPIDRIRAAQSERRRRLEVPEWDLVLYFGPLTTADIEAVEDRLQDDDGKDPQKHRHDRNLLLLIHKAEMEDGTRAFDFGDRHTLKSVADYATLQRVVAFMYASAISTESVEDAKKKSALTPDSASA